MDPLSICSSCCWWLVFVCFGGRGCLPGQEYKKVGRKSDISPWSWPFTPVSLMIHMFLFLICKSLLCFQMFVWMITRLHAVNIHIQLLVEVVSFSVPVHGRAWGDHFAGHGHGCDVPVYQYRVEAESTAVFVHSRGCVCLSVCSRSCIFLCTNTW